MDIRLGASFHPDLGGFSFLIDPTIHAEVANFLTLWREARMAKEAGETYTVYLGDVLAFGAEVRLLRFLKLRAGYYRGNVSLGVGAKLLFLDANVAAYIGPKARGQQIVVDETGVGNLGSVGLTAEIALRF
jgi:hypothetical protein